MPNYVIQLIVGGGGAAQRAIAGVTGALGGANQQANQLNRTMANLATIAVGGKFIKLVDTYTSISNKLKTVSNGQDDLAQNMERTFKIAQDNRVEWESLAKTYSRIQRSTRELRMSQNEVADMTDTLTKAIQLSGATTSETNAVLLQFGQALSKGKLDGDEFKSVMENSVEVGNILTKSLGVTRGELMKMSKAGKVTTAVIVKAFAEARTEIVSRFGDAVPTIASRFTQLKNAVVKSLGEAVAPMKTLGDTIGFVTNNVGLLVKALLFLGPVVLGVQVVRGVQAATVAIRAFTLALATNPVMAMTVAILALIAASKELAALGPPTENRKLGSQGSVLKSTVPSGDIQGSITQVLGTVSGQHVLNDLEANLATLKKAIDEAMDVTPMERFIAKMRELTLVSDGIRAHWQVMQDVAVAMTKGVTEAVIKNVERAVKKAEEARREAAAFKKEFEGWRGSLNPAAQAVQELDDGIAMIDKALRRHVITVMEAEDLYRRLAESIQGVNQIAADRTGGAVDIVNDDRFGNTRVQTAPTFLASTSLPKAGMERTDLLLEQDAQRNKVAPGADELRAQAAILDELRGKERERIDRMMAITTLVAKGTVTQAEYNAEVKKLTDEEMLEGIRKLDQEFVILFDNATDALADFLYTGEFGFRKMVDAMLRNISRLLAQQLIMGALGATTGASSGNWISAGAAMMGQKGFASGGSFMVGGNPGTDTNMVAFRATRGERVTVETPGQQARSAKGGGGSANVTLVNPWDPRRMADSLNTPAGQRAMNDAIRKQPSIVTRRTK